MTEKLLTGALSLNTTNQPILLKFLLFSAQILGFSVDFHRKSLDSVKQHPNNAEMWANGVF